MEPTRAHVIAVYPTIGEAIADGRGTVAHTSAGFEVWNPDMDIDASAFPELFKALTGEYPKPKPNA